MGQLRFATVWLGGCSGCHMSFLDLDEFLIDLADRADIVYSPVVDTKVFPDGVDVYFDNVGGPVLETILELMNVHGRIVCCGAVSQYDKGPLSQATATRGVPGLLIMQRLRMEGILLLDFAKRFREAEAELAGWLEDGRLIALEDVFDGLESAPDALIGLLRGDNVGKRMVRVGPDPDAAPG